MPEIPLLARARLHSEFVAFRTENVSFTYDELLSQSAALAATLLDQLEDLGEARVALLVPAGPGYVVAQWGIWRAGGVVVPISLSATSHEWEYALKDSGASAVVVTALTAPTIAPLCERLNIRVIAADAVRALQEKALPEIVLQRRAMVLYTSGTTNRPKGVVTTHANIQAQIESLVIAWEWSSLDRIPLFLPLHHIHGIINIVGCALWSGATIEPFAHFDVSTILERVRRDAYTLFMAVPTIYVKLIKEIESMRPEDRDSIVAGFKRMRLMVSGSSALPGSVYDRWRELTDQTLLERYGMTEIGMAISNPYRGERRAGAVGTPLPGVQIRLKAEEGRIITREDEPGEIQVRGPAVFAEYWSQPEATAQSFDGGWFRTGDIAVLEKGFYRIMGRLSVDIIKSGGYKLSALEIEAALLEHPHIDECAVVGLPDDTWGEAVTAVVVLREASHLDLPALRDWCRSRLSAYKIPQRLQIVPALPRNAMGKVTKPAVRASF